jgi:hypothetical protein
MSGKQLVAGFLRILSLVVLVASLVVPFPQNLYMIILALFLWIMPA